ncbi:MAG TPA: ComEC/Rec2 family competence protein [Candidatus Paceibacterota bacterium]|nr:ComEC/Rec2 family competence protein [Candidatus Paceibacterota bacterium]
MPPRHVAISDAAFYLICAYCAGIFAAGRSLNFLLIGGGLAATLYFCGNRIGAWGWKFAGLVAAVFIFGGFYYQWYLARDARTLTVPFDRNWSMVATVTEDPHETDAYEVFTAEPWHSHAAMILAPPVSGFRYGDLVYLSGVMHPPDSPGDNPLYVATYARLVAHGRGFWLRQWLETLKGGVISLYQRYLSPDEAALLGGITIGAANTMSATLKAQMAASQTSYVLSMYGYKIAATTSLAAVILANFFSRKIIFPATLAVAALFVVMAGAPASAVRAGIMVSMALTANEFGRTLDKRNAIAGTAGVMLLINPLLLAHDAGFELSCLSVIGIVYLQTPIKRWWGYADSGFLDWKGGIVTTLAVLAPMIPFITNADGQFSLTAIISNGCMFLATPFTVAFGFVLALAGWLVPPSGYSIALLGKIILHYQLAIVRIFSTVVIMLPVSFHAPLTLILYYLGLGIFAFYANEDH